MREVMFLLLFAFSAVTVGVAIGLSRSKPFRDNPRALAYWSLAMSLLVAIPTVIDGLRAMADWSEFLVSGAALFGLLVLVRNAWWKTRKG